MKPKRIVIEIIIFLGLAFILNVFDIRFCPFFNFFKIPCVGCGLTRSAMCFFNGNLIESIRYNILGIPITVCIIIYIIFFIIKKTDVIDYILLKNQNIIIIISIILIIVTWIININNPILY